MDMSKFIIAKSDQLNSDDLVGGPITVTISGVKGSDNPEQPVSISYEGDAGKPYKPCKSMRRVMVGVWGMDAAKYVGRSMTLYRDPDVQFGGMKVGGIRISHMSDIDAKKSMALTSTRGKKGLYTVQPLTGAAKTATQPSFDRELAQLRAAARPGDAAGLEREWKSIGVDARKALAGELDALKAACEPEGIEPDDVPFDAPAQQQEAGYDGV